MSFKDRVKEAAAFERRESILLMRVLVCGLWFFLGVVVGQGICVLFGVQNESIGVIIRLATVILGAWGIMHFLARAMLRNSSKIIEKRICSHFPEGTTVDEVYAMADRMEEVIIPGNSGMIRCNSEGIAYVVRTQQDGSNYGVMPADKIKNMRLKNNLIMIDGNAAFANSAQEAWKAFYEIANRTGRTDQLAPRKVICAALNIVRMRLLQEMIKYTGIKMEKSVDIFFRITSGNPR